MEERTRAYLRGRFSDYYRRVEPAPPPAAERREWGYIPWTGRPGTTMVRHRSLLDLGDLGAFLERERPRHVYFSAGRYDDPGADGMEAKGWQGSDLIFDLDADHLPGVDPDDDTYADMLSTCKDALQDLLSFLREDFGFSDPEVVFSGSRGYHVHVRDESIRALDRSARRQIVEYVRGIDLDAEALLTAEPVAGESGRRTPASRRSLDARGGWSRRVHRRLVSFVEDLLAMPEADAIARLREFEGIGPERARSALAAARENTDQIREGNIDVHPAFVSLVGVLACETVADGGVAIDEPVTTDTHRLIRLPHSLHGGTALAVTPVDPDDLGGFDPLVDAIPAPFVGHEIAVRATGGPPVKLGGETFTVPDGATRLPEYAAMFLMARGRAEKERETQ